MASAKRPVWEAAIETTVKLRRRSHRNLVRGVPPEQPALRERRVVYVDEVRCLEVRGR